MGGLPFGILGIFIGSPNLPRLSYQTFRRVSDYSIHRRGRVATFVFLFLSGRIKVVL